MAAKLSSIISIFLINRDSYSDIVAQFLELAFVCDVGMRVCVCSHPRGYKLLSCDIEPVQPAEQVCCI